MDILHNEEKCSVCVCVCVRAQAHSLVEMRLADHYQVRVLSGLGRGEGRFSSQCTQDTHELPWDRAVQHHLQHSRTDGSHGVT